MTTQKSILLFVALVLIHVSSSSSFAHSPESLSQCFFSASLNKTSSQTPSFSLNQTFISLNFIQSHSKRAIQLNSNSKTHHHHHRRKIRVRSPIDGTCTKQAVYRLKLRSGGHDFEGLSYTSDKPFFILNMFNFKQISVDVDEQSAWVGAGATLGELYYRIWEKRKTHGFPAGVCPTVDVGGHLSGGGYGNMLRNYCLSIDNVLDVKLVDVKGRILDRDSMGEDLFGAICGGGGASFGVVVAYKIKLESKQLESVWD